MKKFLWLLVLIFILIITYTHKDSIVNFIMKKVIDKDIAFDEPNSYYKDVDYSLVQNTVSLYPTNRQDILNIIYTTLNRGLNEVTFYCKYDECLDDVNDIAEDNLYLSTINNLVHPYNNYSKIYFTINKYGEIHINVSKIYSDNDIILINNKINNIVNSIIDDNMSDYEKILAFHDYIIDHTIYDETVSIETQLESSTNANNAIGLLFEGKAICSGYSDVMAIFLSKYGFNNIKISSDEHIWNLVYINGAWKHIDVTWDDPVTNDGADVLLHDFFLVNTNELFEKEKTFEKFNHQFNTDLYLEAM